MQMTVVRSRELDTWIAARHYLKSAPACSILRLEFTENGERIGAMLWNKPTSPHSDQKYILELTRMFFVDDTERFIESKALAMARRYIRKSLPHIRGLFAYSSTTEGHKGTIYEADGWFLISKTQNKTGNWESRVGRVNRDLSAKIKFGRTP
jgi:hypothetical protein